MKKYLYEIDYCDKCGNLIYDHSTPFMPRVFAEKQAKQMNKDIQRRYGKQTVKYKVKNTGIRTNDSTPRGWASWEDWYLHKFGCTR